MKYIDRPTYKAWMRIVKKLGTIQGYILFSIIYIVVVGIYALCFFLYTSIRNVIGRKRNIETYWVADGDDECDALTQVQRQF